MKEEDAIEAIAWQLAKAQKRDPARETLDADEIDQIRAGQSSPELMLRVAQDDDARQQLLEASGVADLKPSASIRERVLASRFSTTPKPVRWRAPIQWAAAVAVIGLGLSLFIMQPESDLSVSTAEFSALSFQVTATGLQELRGTDGPAHQSGLRDPLRIDVYRDSPIAIVIESSVTPTHPLQYAVFQETDSGVRRILDVELTRYPGAVRMSLSAHHVSASRSTTLRLYAVVSRDGDIRAADVVAGQRVPSAGESDRGVRVYPVEVSVLER